MLPESRDRNRDSLSPDMREEIEDRFNTVTNRSGLLAEAALYYLKRAIVIVLVLSGLTFFLDYVKLRTTANAFGSVTIRRYYAVGLKNGRTEMSMAESQSEMCVNSVFPHLGYYPCWYLRRHDTKQIDI
jgi:hypothetical protein